mmetsp:Transcript_10822/g.19760  ORF Transcript_10822/g.19760 Transcript_10822/m.19760 type:complete len:371 (-) Transcript_10822:193-1305(-)
MPGQIEVDSELVEKRLKCRLDVREFPNGHPIARVARCCRIDGLVAQDNEPAVFRFLPKLLQIVPQPRHLVPPSPEECLSRVGKVGFCVNGHEVNAAEIEAVPHVAGPGVGHLESRIICCEVPGSVCLSLFHFVLLEELRRRGDPARRVRGCLAGTENLRKVSLMVPWADHARHVRAGGLHCIEPFVPGLLEIGSPVHIGVCDVARHPDHIDSCLCRGAERFRSESTGRKVAFACRGARTAQPKVTYEYEFGRGSSRGFRGCEVAPGREVLVAHHAVLVGCAWMQSGHSCVVVVARCLAVYCVCPRVGRLSASGRVLRGPYLGVFHHCFSSHSGLRAPRNSHASGVAGECQMDLAALRLWLCAGCLCEDSK